MNADWNAWQTHVLQLLTMDIPDGMVTWGYLEQHTSQYGRLIHHVAQLDNVLLMNGDAPHIYETIDRTIRRRRDSISAVVIRMPFRSVFTEEVCALVEQMKSGVFVDKEFAGRSLTFNPMKILIVSNSMPDKEMAKSLEMNHTTLG